MALVAFVVGPAFAETVIRDTEIENTIGQIADPIFDAAGLPAGEVKVYVLRNDQLNAFVAGGQNLFLNTGLIIRTENPGQLAGVVAHETGHIAGGHLSRAGGARESAGYETLLGALLGAAAAVAGAPQVGTALFAGGATVAQSGYLAFSRSQEQAADQAAVGFLADEHKSPRGLLEFFKILQNQNLGISADGATFLRSHPLTRDRISFLEHEVAISPYRDAPWPPALVEAHARMVAKLDAYLGDPAEVLRRYEGTSVVDRYAQAIALYRESDVATALDRLSGLIKREPKNPYFPELKGQFEFETGHAAAAEASYRDALRWKPDAPLIRIGLARALMEEGDEAKMREARALLTEAARLEPRDASTWHFLGIVEGKLGNRGAAALALAEENVLLGRKNDARIQLATADQLIRPQDPNWLRLEDLKRAVADLPEPRARRY